MYLDLFRRKDSPQYNARIMLQRIKSARNFTIIELAESMGNVGSSTLQKFLGHELDVRLKTFTNILDYIEAEKHRLGM